MDPRVGLSPQYDQERAPPTQAWPGPSPGKLTPLWEECCWAIPRKDWNGVFPPEKK